MGDPGDETGQASGSVVWNKDASIVVAAVRRWSAWVRGHRGRKGRYVQEAPPRKNQWSLLTTSGWAMGNKEGPVLPETSEDNGVAGRRGSGEKGGAGFGDNGELSVNILTWK